MQTYFSILFFILANAAEVEAIGSNRKLNTAMEFGVTKKDLMRRRMKPDISMSYFAPKTGKFQKAEEDRGADFAETESNVAEFMDLLPSMSIPTIDLGDVYDDDDDVDGKASKTGSKGQKLSPKSTKGGEGDEGDDEIAPKADKMAPKSEKMAPKSYKKAPKSYKMAPKADKMAPKSEKMAPKATVSPKADKGSIPKGAMRAIPIPSESESESSPALQYASAMESSTTQATSGAPGYCGDRIQFAASVFVVGVGAAIFL